ncbi:alanine racemase [Nocardioides acrostichi]|uniref:Alanine racemase n=1 Tax=Nocardioides acrostichi TaxID=2784339 RepID=A0A930UZG7_9ACTN|nr:alanine racemase [Nocardioides acrostichi]MBF4162911.1 alanine racemase [Nocardioides acrostichi]
MSAPPRAELVVDLDALRHNVRLLRAEVGEGVAMMTVVKADGYGHGMLEVARAAREAGADWLGVATLDEAATLRAAGDSGPLLAWLTTPGEDRAPAVVADVDLSASSTGELAEIADAATRAGKPARVHLKVDTGLSRGGATGAEWPALLAAAVHAAREGRVEVTGLWSHFAASDEPAHRANDVQEQRFRDAVAAAESAGLHPRVRHLANSAAALLRPTSRFDLVRCGIASYGLDPAPGQPGTARLDLRPVMTARATLALVKEVAAGEGVSYGHTWLAPHRTVLGLVPVGYGDGVPRHASNRAEVGVAGARRPVRGRVCMDQFVVELGPGDPTAAGADVTLFGAAPHPSAQDWAEACETISYEIVTRIGGRFVRRHVNRHDQGARSS